jgi:hypothetical protein
MATLRSRGAFFSSITWNESVGVDGEKVNLLAVSRLDLAAVEVEDASG